MQKYAKLTVTIKPDGTAEHHIEGVEGTGCETIEELFDQMGTVLKSEDTEEMYLQSSDNPQHLNLGG
jgi:hypothetical protein